MDSKVFLICILLVSVGTACQKNQNGKKLRHEFSRIPTGYSQQLEPKDFKQGALEGSCPEIDGPKKFFAVFEAQEKKIGKLERWTNEHRFLYERALAKLNQSEVFIAVTQYGCSHYGHNLVIKRPLPYWFTNVEEVLKFLKDFTKLSIFTAEGKKALQEGINILSSQLEARELKKRCSVSEDKINCTLYQDPKNVELFISKSEIKLNYWYVL